MNLSQQLAKRFRELHFGKNWVSTDIKTEVENLTWVEATTQVENLNTIAKLIYHLNYYVAGVLQVLKGGPLKIRDKYSFDLLPIESQEDWEKLLNKFWKEAEEFAKLLEEMPEEKLQADFINPKYGNYFRNMLSFLEHSHYHLGQIVLIKKMMKK